MRLQFNKFDCIQRFLSFTTKCSPTHCTTITPLPPTMYTYRTYETSTTTAVRTPLVNVIPEYKTTVTSSSINDNITTKQRSASLSKKTKIKKQKSTFTEVKTTYKELLNTDEFDVHQINLLFQQIYLLIADKKSMKARISAVNQSDGLLTIKGIFDATCDMLSNQLNDVPLPILIEILPTKLSEFITPSEAFSISVLNYLSSHITDMPFKMLIDCLCKISELTKSVANCNLHTFYAIVNQRVIDEMVANKEEIEGDTILTMMKLKSMKNVSPHLQFLNLPAISFTHSDVTAELYRLLCASSDDFETTEYVSKVKQLSDKHRKQPEVLFFIIQAISKLPNPSKELVASIGQHLIQLLNDGITIEEYIQQLAYLRHAASSSFFHEAFEAIKAVDWIQKLSSHSLMSLCQIYLPHRYTHPLKFAEELYEALDRRMVSMDMEEVSAVIDMQFEEPWRYLNTRIISEKFCKLLGNKKVNKMMHFKCLMVLHRFNGILDDVFSTSIPEAAVTDLAVNFIPPYCLLLLSHSRLSVHTWSKVSSSLSQKFSSLAEDYQKAAIYELIAAYDILFGDAPQLNNVRQQRFYKPLEKKSKNVYTNWRANRSPFLCFDIKSTLLHNNISINEDVMLESLHFVAPYYLPKQKIIIDAVQLPTSFLMGCVELASKRLRYNIWKQMNYKVLSFTNEDVQSEREFLLLLKDCFPTEFGEPLNTVSNTNDRLEGFEDVNDAELLDIGRHQTSVLPAVKIGYKYNEVLMGRDWYGACTGVMRKQKKTDKEPIERPMDDGDVIQPVDVSSGNNDMLKEEVHHPEDTEKQQRQTDGTHTLSTHNINKEDVQTPRSWLTYIKSFLKR